MTLGADPLLGAISYASAMRDDPLDHIIVRKEPKGHGTGQWIEGTRVLRPGMPVVVLEDVVTTGLSTRECMACVAAEGGRVVAAACLVDRSGGRAELGVPLIGLAALELPVYPADRLPPELAALPAVKPGSRTAPPLA